MMKYLNNCKIIVRAMSKNIVSRWNFKKIELIIHSIYPLFMNELFGLKVIDLKWLSILKNKLTYLLR